jgi:glutaminyl-tRNA synthetase
VLTECKLEPSLKDAAIQSRYQFERLGYFCVDKDSTQDMPVFNRTLNLRDSWAKIQKQKQNQSQNQQKQKQQKQKKK